MHPSSSETVIVNKKIKWKHNKQKHLQIFLSVRKEKEKFSYRNRKGDCKQISWH